MANLLAKDAGDNTIEVAGTGVGSTGDPFILSRRIVDIPAGAADDLVTIISRLDDAITILSARLIAPGQAAMAASSPVVVASNQTAVPVSGGVTSSGPTWTPDNFTVASADLSGGAVDLSAAPTTGEKRVIDALVISVDTAMSVTVKEESGATMFKVYMAANSTVALKDLLRKLDTVNKKIQIQTSVAGNVFAHCQSHSAA